MIRIKNIIIAVCILFVSLLVGCEKEDICVENIKLVSNAKVRINYNNNSYETIEITPPLLPYEKRKLRLKSIGRSIIEFTVLGESQTQPRVLISSFTTKGTKKRPDYIELTFLSDGDAFLYTIMAGKYTYTFPHTYVKEGEKITLHPHPTLSQNNGEIYVYSSSSPFARVLDAAIYTNKNTYVNKKGEWLGEGINSTPSTSVKAIRRKVGDNGVFIDTDTRTDWEIY